MRRRRGGRRLEPLGRSPKESPYCVRRVRSTFRTSPLRERIARDSGGQPEGPASNHLVPTRPTAQRSRKWGAASKRDDSAQGTRELAGFRLRAQALDGLVKLTTLLRHLALLDHEPVELFQRCRIVRPRAAQILDSTVQLLTPPRKRALLAEEVLELFIHDHDNKPAVRVDDS